MMKQLTENRKQFTLKKNGLPEPTCWGLSFAP